MADVPPDRAINTSLRERLALLCGVATCAAGLLGLTGWEWSIPILTTWKPGAGPMAPLAALMLALLGAAITAAVGLPDHPNRRRAVVVLASLAAAAGMAGTLLRLAGVQPGIELLGFSISGTFQNAPVGMVSPVTSVATVALSLSLLATLAHVTAFAVMSRGVIAFVGVNALVLLAAAVLNAPLITNPVSIPASMPASTGLLLGSVALWQIGTLSGAPTGKGLRPYALVFAGVGITLLGVGYLYYQQIARDLRADT